MIALLRTWVNALTPARKVLAALVSVGVAVFTVVTPAVSYVLAWEAQYARKEYVATQLAPLQYAQNEQAMYTAWRWYKETRRQIDDLEAQPQRTSLQRDKLVDLREEERMYLERYRVLCAKLGRC